MAAFSNEVASTLFLYFSGRLSVNYVSFFFISKEVLLFHIVPVDNRDQGISSSENQKWCSMTESRIRIFHFVVHSNEISEPFQAKRDRKYLVKA